MATEMRGTTTIRERARFSGDHSAAASTAGHRSHVELPVVGTVPNIVAILIVLGVVGLFVLSRGGGQGAGGGFAIRDLPRA